jgi:pyruvate kinase
MIKNRLRKKLVKTKFVCTLGPSSSNAKVIEKLIRAGMKVARFNFSHSTPEEHYKVIKLVRKVAKRLNKPIAILQDLPGPKLRIGRLKKRAIFLERGKIVTLTIDDLEGDESIISVNYKNLPKEVKKGTLIYLSDGLIKLQVISKDERNVRCRVMNSGELASGKGIAIPKIKLKIPAVTKLDEEYLKFGLNIDVDYIAISFVRSVDDVNVAREIAKRTGKDVAIISKIEKGEALKNIDQIIDCSDGIMVARGDLGVDIGVDKIPIAQKEIISKCNQAGKPVIVATQILDSMIHNPTPTRAEVTDIANAILDGADALMLSDETAIGRYPVEALKVLVKVSKRAEETIPYEQIITSRKPLTKAISAVVSHAACQAGIELGIKAIVAPTRSGLTAKRVSRYRPPFPIIALTSNENVMRKLCLVWGIYPFLVKEFESLDLMLKESIIITKNCKVANKGDKVIVVAGDPKGPTGGTDFMKVQIIS